MEGNVSGVVNVSRLTSAFMNALSDGSTAEKKKDVRENDELN